MLTLKGNVLARVAPLVGTAVAEHVGEVVVVKVYAVAVVVEVLEVLLAIHENLDGFTAVLHPSNKEDAANRNVDHEQLHTRPQQHIKPILEHLAERNRLETILRAEVLLG